LTGWIPDWLQREIARDYGIPVLITLIGIAVVAGFYLYPSVFVHSLERRAADMIMRWSPSASPLRPTSLPGD
jgi:hypothetical protein